MIRHFPQVACAAAASFIFGALAATAVSPKLQTTSALDVDYHKDPAAAHSPADFAEFVTNAACATYAAAPDDCEDMWKNSGYFACAEKFSKKDCAAFKWKSDSNPETVYHYDQSPPEYPGAYKLWKRSCEANPNGGCPGFYKVEHECAGGGQGAFCWMHFYCLESNTGNPYWDC